MAVTAAPLLYLALAVPPRFTTTHNDLVYGGDVRIGDLTGNGHVDFLVFRSADAGMKPCFIGAFDMAGDPLWQAGSGGSQPARPGSVAIHDIDADGAAEVICLWHDRQIDAPQESMRDVVVQSRNGRTGRVKCEAAPPAITDRSGSGPNWVHQRILICNLRGTDTPRDFVIKLGDTIVAMDQELTVLWTYHIKWNEYGSCSAYIPSVGDIDGDGRDEVNGGYFLLDSDGTPMWEKQLGHHMDSVAITEWDDGNARAVCSGYGHVMDARGNAILTLGPQIVPHGQEARVGNLRDDLPGPELILRYNAHTPPVIIVSSDTGEVEHEFDLNPTPNNTGMMPVYWNGPEKPALICNGRYLWNGHGEEVAEMPDLPPVRGPHRMGWYHCIPADICGDRREEVVLYNPWADHVYVYTPEPLDEAAYGGYQPGPRQYNARIMD